MLVGLSWVMGKGLLKSLAAAGMRKEESRQMPACSLYRLVMLGNKAPLIIVVVFVFLFRLAAASLIALIL